LERLRGEIFEEHDIKLPYSLVDEKVSLTPREARALLQFEPQVKKWGWSWHQIRRNQVSMYFHHPSYPQFFHLLF